MNVHIQHTTRYSYEKPVGFGFHKLYLHPRECANTHVSEFNIQCNPNGNLRWIRDCFDNEVAVLYFDNSKGTELEITCNIVVDTFEFNPFDFILTPHATNFPFRYTTEEQNALGPYLQEGFPPHASEVLNWYYDNVPQNINNTIEFITTLCDVIYTQFKYERREDEGTHSANKIISLKSGSCRDFAILFIQTCRQLGLAARFVSGYLCEQIPEEDHHQFQLPLSHAQNSMHAWTEVYLPGAGWIGIDPTNNVLTTHHFISTAVASDPSLISTIQGGYISTKKVESTMHVDLNITQTAHAFA